MGKCGVFFRATSLSQLLLALGIEVNWDFLTSAKQKDVGSSLAVDQNFLCILFRLCGFFRNFFSCHQRFLPSFVWYFATERMLKNPKGFLLQIFRHYETVENFHFCVFLKFFMSRFIFLKFCNRMDVEKISKCPLLQFSAL